MATTAIWDVSDRLKRVLNYAVNPEKTNQGRIEADGLQQTLVSDKEHFLMDLQNTTLRKIDDTDERYFRSLKYECIYLSEFEDPRALRKGIAQYVQFYNKEWSATIIM